MLMYCWPYYDRCSSFIEVAKNNNFVSTDLQSLLPINSILFYLKFSLSCTGTVEHDSLASQRFCDANQLQAVVCGLLSVDSYLYIQDVDNKSLV